MLVQPASQDLLATLDWARHFSPHTVFPDMSLGIPQLPYPFTVSVFVNTERALEQQDALQLGVSRDGVPSCLAVRTGSPLPHNSLDTRATKAQRTATHHVRVTHYL